MENRLVSSVLGVHLRRLPGALLVGLTFACSSSLDNTANAPAPSRRPNAPPESSEVDVRPASPVGWASVVTADQDGTTGGGDLEPTQVSTIDEFTAAAAGDVPAVIQLAASMDGSVRIGSNKTILGTLGVVFSGHIGVGSVRLVAGGPRVPSRNVILRDLTIVGNNCLDDADCQNGADAVTIDGGAHHVWVDHCDISNGSDGNLDVASAADYVTISWTKFWYLGQRPGGHQFSNLIGSSDDDTGDAGHLRVTFHHDWWADNIGERMPRARYGQVHLFNNLYTAVGDSYCVGVGWNVSILTENTVFSGVRVPFNTTSFASATSVAVSYGNLYLAGAQAVANRGDAAFDPPYAYTLQPVAAVARTVIDNVGPR